MGAVIAWLTAEECSFDRSQVGWRIASTSFLRSALSKPRSFIRGSSRKNNHMRAENTTLNLLKEVAVFAIRRASRRWLILPLLACCSSLHADVITFEEK